MNDEELLQYSRQIMLPQIDLAGQQRLLDSRALIVGLGGLGAPVALYLAAAGVGELVLVDFDTVDLTNLQRQIIYSHDAIGTPKVRSAQATLARINPRCRVRPIAQKLEGEALERAVAEADVVLDCSDNFATRFAINRACVRQGKPLVSGSAIRWEGQVAVFNDRPGAPCYHCLYGDSGELDASCAANGILAPVVGIIGSIQATEAIKLLTGAGEPLSGRLLLLDALTMELRTLKLRPDPGCPVCGK